MRPRKNPPGIRGADVSRRGGEAGRSSCRRTTRRLVPGFCDRPGVERVEVEDAGRLGSARRTPRGLAPSPPAGAPRLRTGRNAAPGWPARAPHDVERFAVGNGCRRRPRPFTRRGFRSLRCRGEALHRVAPRRPPEPAPAAAPAAARRVQARDPAPAALRQPPGPAPAAAPAAVRQAQVRDPAPAALRRPPGPAPATAVGAADPAPVERQPAGVPRSPATPAIAGCRALLVWSPGDTQL